MVQIPAYCPSCGLLFPSGIDIGEGATANLENNVSVCPNGHEANILDGTFSVTADAIRIIKAGKISQQVLARIQLVAERVAAKETSPNDALNEVAELVPGELGAAIKQLGPNNAFAKLLMVLAALGMMSFIAVNMATAYRNAFKTDPPRNITIRNHNTIINTPAPTGQRDQSVTKPLNRHERRRAKKLERKNKKNRPDGQYR